MSKHDVKFLLIGGYAVAYYGYVRTTGDLDIFVEDSPENAKRLVAACHEFGLGETVVDALFLEPGNIVRFGAPPMRLEILNQISGVEFFECWERRNVLSLSGVEVPIISYEELLKNKRASGRTKDLLDVEMLSDSEGSGPSRPIV